MTVTRSASRIIDEQAHGCPEAGEFCWFDGRVHTYEAVNRRINNVVRGLIAVGVRQGDRVGVLMETGPARWSPSPRQLGWERFAGDAARHRPVRVIRLGRVTEILTDLTNLMPRASCPDRCRCWVVVKLRDLVCRADALEQGQSHRHGKIGPGRCRVAGGIDRIPDWRTMFIARCLADGDLRPSRSPTTAGGVGLGNRLGTAALGRRDTVYCLTPLHHESALLVSLGGAVMGGTHRIVPRLAPGPVRGRVRQYGVTVVS